MITTYLPLPSGFNLPQMRSRRHEAEKCLPGVILLAFLLVLFTLPSLAEDTRKDYLLDRALESIAMKRDDLSIRPDLSTNPFALSLFT